MPLLSLLDSLTAILVALTGALLTIITVVYSLAYTKRENLKVLAEEKKAKGADQTPMLNHKIVSSVHYLKRMNRVLKFSVYILSAAVLFSIVSLCCSAIGLAKDNIISIVLVIMDGLILVGACIYYIHVARQLKRDIDIKEKTNN